MRLAKGTLTMPYGNYLVGNFPLYSIRYLGPVCAEKLQVKLKKTHKSTVLSKVPFFLVPFLPVFASIISNQLFLCGFSGAAFN